MSKDAQWVNDVIEKWQEDHIPEGCQQFGCNQPVETWCSLCRAFFCHEHDELYPVRRHDCLKGRAEVA